MKQLIGALFLSLPLVVQAIDKDIKSDECETTKACISRISEVLDTEARPGRSPSSKELAIVKKLLELGDTAMPSIVGLLENDNELIARIGAYALREAEQIDESYLPQILKGLDKDVSWLAPALAKIGTPEAAKEAVQRFLVSDSAPHNQEAYALRLLGQKAIPFIVNAALCKNTCKDDTYYLLGYALGEMGSERAYAAKQLIKIASDVSVVSDVSYGALYMISFLGEPGLIIENELLALRKQRPFLADAINNALIGIKSEHAGSIYSDILKQGVDRYILRDIAELGPKAMNAGPDIAILLNHDDGEIRLSAARTLGYIQYRPAAPELIALLNEPTDVQLNWVAAESLGRMHEKSAIEALTATSKNHWYPPVKDAAVKALEHIKSGKRYTSNYHKDNFAFDYFDYQHMSMESCDAITLKTKPESGEFKIYKSNAKEKLEKLAYSTVILSYGANNEEEQKAEDPDGIIEVNQSNMVEHRQDIKQIPDLALRINDGWLAGSSRGEWGGELVLIPDNGKAIKLLDDNIEDIYKLGERYITTTGLAHLTMNNGMIFELKRDEDGNWFEKPWKKLPGSPYSSWFVETGELLINTSGGGSILLSEDGAMRMASCQ